MYRYNASGAVTKKKLVRQSLVRGGVAFQKLVPSFHFDIKSAQAYLLYMKKSKEKP